MGGRYFMGIQRKKIIESIVESSGSVKATRGTVLPYQDLDAISSFGNNFNIMTYIVPIKVNKCKVSCRDESTHR
jgi:hypothetical protein